MAASVCRSICIRPVPHALPLLCCILAAMLLALPAAAQSPKPGVPSDAYNNSQRVEGWRADLKCLLDELPKRHINAFTKITQEDWLSAAAALDKQIPELSDDEVVIGMMRLVNLLDDSHTALDGISRGGFRFYPLGLYWFSDGLYVLQTTTENKQLLAARLDTINGQPALKCAETVGAVVPHENASQLKSQTPFFMVIAEVLSTLGITDGAERASFGFTLKSGEQQTVELAALAPSKDTKYETALDPATPLPYYTHNGDQQYFSEWLPLSETLYIAYNSCSERDDLSMADFTKQVIDGLNGMPAKKMVIDLRANSGGNSALLDPLIDLLAQRQDVNQTGKLFVLIGRRTFSSAVLNALSLKDKTAALLVGEPTGGKPSHFGEVKQFQLPISGLSVSYSTKYFDHHSDKSDSLKPDIAVAVSAADFLAGRDMEMQAVSAYI